MGGGGCFILRSPLKTVDFWWKEEKNNPLHSPVGPRPKLLYFTKSANACYIWSTKLGSWKYCLLVKSPTLDRPLKSQTCFKIYYHKCIYLPKACNSLESLPQTRLLIFVPAEGNQEPCCWPEPSSHPEGRMAGDFVGPWQLIRIMWMALSWPIFSFSFNNLCNCFRKTN